MSNVLVLGSGFSGATTAYLLSKQGYTVTVLEKNSHPGGGCWTKFYGGQPYTFGPRVFFTWDEEVYEQISSLVKIRDFYTRTWTYVESDNNFFHYPIQKRDLKQMHDYESIVEDLSHSEKIKPSILDFKSYWIDVVGLSLYNKFIRKYSKKMWGIDSNKELVADFKWVNKGTPIRNGDDRLYTDQIQGYPESKEGYNDYFLKCLKDSKVFFNCKIKGFDPDKKVVRTNLGEFSSEIIVNTIHIDSLFEYQYGRLRYCGRELLKVMLPIENALPEKMTWIHYSGDEPYTRVTEFKKITNFNSSFTLLGIEIPSGKNRLYPIQSEPELKRYKLYKTLFPDNFYSIGRLGTFKYKGIEDAIREAINISRIIS